MNSLWKDLAVTYEMCGSPELSEGAMTAILEKLEKYPYESVLKSLKRCQDEVHGRLALADIIQRIDDGRPGAEEAWGMIPQDEWKTVVWCDEMAEAWGIASSILSAGDEVGARMAFKEAYNRLIREARSSGVKPHYWVSLGHDIHGREHVIREAVDRGRISLEHAQRLLPDSRITEEMQELLGGVTKRLTGGNSHAG